LPFDLQPYVPVNSQEGQLVEGGQDSWENCTFACLGATMIAYLSQAGVANTDPLEPQEMRSGDGSGWPGVDPNGHGGEPWTRSQAVIWQRPDLYPHPPQMEIHTPADLISTLDFYGSSGYLVHWAGWCTPGGDWLTQEPANGLSHAGQVLAYDGSQFTLWNPIVGLVTLTASDLLAAYDGGGILVFLGDLTMSVQDVVTGLQQYFDGIIAPGQLSPGGTIATTLEDVQQLINQEGDAEAKLAAIQATLASGPAPSNGSAILGAIAALKSELDEVKAELEALSKHVGVGTA
jgi:hypothetical protein